MRLRTWTATLALGALAALSTGAAPVGADAAGTVTVLTHTMNHPDTTSVSGPCTTTSDNGPVWAYDNLALRYAVTPTGTDTYSVLITAHGSFAAFADPNTGDCYSGHGSVSGWLQWDVTSSTPPDPSSVLAQQDGATGQTAILLDQLFDGNVTSLTGGSYSYSYTLVDGTTYTQVG